MCGLEKMAGSGKCEVYRTVQNYTQFLQILHLLMVIKNASDVEEQRGKGTNLQYSRLSVNRHLWELVEFYNLNYKVL